MKKIITLILALLMALSFAACASDTGEELPPRERNTATTTPTNADAPSENNDLVVTTAAEETPTDPPPTLTVDWNKAANPPAGLTAAPIDDFTYTYDSALRGITIEKYKGDDSQVLIPAEIEGEPVIAIAARTFENKTNLEYIYFPDTLVRIDANAFQKCPKLTLVIPDNVEIDGTVFISIDVKDLALCTRMFGMNNSNKLRFFETIAKSDTLENILYDNVTYNFTNNREATVAELYELLVNGCYETDLAISNLWAYKYVDYTDHFDGGYGIQGIAVTEYKFQNSSNIKVEIPSMIEGTPVVSVGIFRGTRSNKVFDGRSGVIEITIPDSVLAIGFYAFHELKSLETINMSKNIIVIDEYAFYDTAISEILLPDTLLEIRRAAFTRCNSLTLLTLPDNINKIGFTYKTNGNHDELSIVNFITNPTVIVYKGQTYTNSDLQTLATLIND